MFWNNLWVSESISFYKQLESVSSIALFRIYNMNSLPYSFIKVSQFFLKNFQPVWFFVYFLIWHSCMFLALIISLQSQSLTFIDFLCLFWSMVFIFLFHFFFLISFEGACLSNVLVKSFKKLSNPKFTSPFSLASDQSIT